MARLTIPFRRRRRSAAPASRPRQTARTRRTRRLATGASADRAPGPDCLGAEAVGELLVQASIAVAQASAPVPEVHPRLSRALPGQPQRPRVRPNALRPEPAAPEAAEPRFRAQGGGSRGNQGFPRAQVPPRLQSILAI